MPALFSSSGGVGGGLQAPASPTAFNQSANSTTATVVPAAVNVGTLTLLGDVITAIGALQSAVNTNTRLLNSVIDSLQSVGIAI